MTEPVFRRVRTIEGSDADRLGHVNNVTWLRFAVELADAHSSSVGLDVEATLAVGGYWIVRRHEIEYHASAEPGDRVVEETWVAEFRGARSLRRFRFSREDGTVLVSGATSWAYLDAESHRPRRVDAAVKAAFPVLDRDEP